jgi:hypothetical protein
MLSMSPRLRDALEVIKCLRYISDLSYFNLSADLLCRNLRTRRSYRSQSIKTATIVISCVILVPVMQKQAEERRRIAAVAHSAQLKKPRLDVS